MRDKSSKDAFEKVTNPDGSPIRDKDNAFARPTPPSWSRKPAPNLAPGGMLGIKTGLPRPAERASEPAKKPSVSNDVNQPDASQWIDGKITTMKGYSFDAKMYDEPSKFGIDGGKISKLDVRKDGDLVMRYDRGWDKGPQTPEHKEALQRIRNGLGDTPQKEFKGFDHKPDKDPSIDR